MTADNPSPPLCSSRDQLPHLLAAAILAAVVSVAYGSCVTGVVGYADDYWLLWQWREQPESVLDVWNSAGRFVSGVLFRLVWRDADEIGDLWRPRLAAIVGLYLLSLGTYATMRRMDYSWWMSVALSGLIPLLPTFAVYAAWATSSGHIFGCLAALGAFAVADVGWRDRPWWQIPLWIGGGIALEAIALCVYQPAGMFYVVACMLALASRAMNSWSWHTRIRVAAHAAVLIAGMAAAFLVFKASAGEVENIDLAKRATLTTDPVVKVARFVAQPLAQSCLPFWFTNQWPNAARAGVAVVFLGILVPLGAFVRLEGSASGRVFRTAGLLALVPLSYLPHLIVAADFFPYRTRAAIAPAVLFLLVLAASGGLRKCFPDVSRRRAAAQLILAAVACAALIAARHHIMHGFVVPSQVEWAVVRSEVLREAERSAQPEQIVFLMPDSSRPLTSRFVYDEFGYLSSSHPWTCRGMTGLAVVDVAPQSLPAFRRARFVEMDFDAQAPKRSGTTWIIDARQINTLARRGEGSL